MKLTIPKDGETWEGVGEPIVDVAALAQANPEEHIQTPLAPAEFRLPPRTPMVADPYGEQPKV